MTFEVTILGSSSATPAYNRNPSSQVLNINEKLYLIDCGEATQHQMNKYRVKHSRIDHIFISHLHGDHYLGLLGLISTMHLNGRVKPLELFAPEPLKEIIDLHLHHSQTVLRYNLNFHPIPHDKPTIIFESNHITVETIILKHRIPCTGFLFQEKSRKRRVNMKKLEEHQISLDHINLLKDGFDYTEPGGKTIPNEELTLDPFPVRSYAYCSDTIYTEDFLDQIKDADMLYHEATFMHDMLDRATETYHTTALQAGSLAAKTKVKKLIIGHFSARYKDLTPLLNECRSVFRESYLAEEGAKYSFRS